MRPIEYLRNALKRDDAEPVSMQSEQMTIQANKAANDKQKAVAQHKQGVLSSLSSPQMGGM